MLAASVLPSVTETPTRSPDGTRTSGSTGPVSSTTWPDRSGRITASWLASVVSRLLLQEDRGRADQGEQQPRHDVRRADQGPARSRTLHRS